ncbi:hypothetical protein ACQR1W_31085 [Bradyrhizobium sp. HKCCYLS1011]|uniref:hypothetical protein n=1 Tax=Bradyrhizobium sp. HKCCYLS1011 TaxID=3420733 RepID=UPI003EBD4F18
MDPSGPNSDRLYHGLIWIPGVHSDLVRIAGAITGPMVIPPTVDPHNAILRLGYEDDHYGDNGYWGHDDGTENQCRGVGNAFVTLTIDHGRIIPTPPAPFDLVHSATDANGFPLNPKWAWQQHHPGSLPNADTQCFPLPGVFSNTQCTTQAPSIDVPDGWNAFWCAQGAQHSIHGHVNWLPATWEGTVSWDGHSSPGTDDDYNINVVPPAGEGLTVSSGGHIHSEFDSDETIDHFRTPWWNSFHEAVDRDDASARAMIDGKFAIVVGLAGLDCEHGCATELHPVYALAIHVNDNPQDDTWAIFVRNWGNEGYCSQDQHPLDTNRMAFLLPRPAATAVNVVASTFLTNTSEASGPFVSLVSGQGAIVEFGLPDPAKGARINGELHLQWTVTPGVIAVFRPPLDTAAEALGPHLVEIEQRLENLEKQLPPDARRAMTNRLARARSFDEVTPSKLEAAQPRLAHPASTRAGPDPHKAQRDLERAKAICTAFRRSIPGMPNACASVPQ